MKVIFEENFGEKLGQGWTWVHEEPAAWKIVDGALHLRTLPGTLWGDANNGHNFLLRLVEDLSNGLTIRVSVTNEPQLMSEQAGLIWYHDDDNYIKLVKESLEGVEWIVMAREEGGQPELVDKTRVAAPSAELQLVLVDGALHGQFRISSENKWQEVGKCALLGEAALKVGLFTHGGPAEIERWAEMRDFSMLKP
jgi:regulation of enolase protein 1 (concanavalin A-like superfamily)